MRLRGFFYGRACAIAPLRLCRRRAMRSLLPFENGRIILKAMVTQRF
jgi:hypothetical protein